MIYIYIYIYIYVWRWQPQWDGGAAVERDAFRARVWQGLQAPAINII